MEVSTSWNFGTMRNDGGWMATLRIAVHSNQVRPRSVRGSNGKAG
jgi:hypothetical protein